MNEKYLRTRRFWLFLPVLIVPIITIFFWLMGGGSAVAVGAPNKSGLNTQLPSGRGGKDSAKDKLGFYLSADADSVKRKEQIQMDPYRRDSSSTTALHSFSLPKYQNASVSTQANDITAKIAAIQKRVAENGRAEPGYTDNKTAHPALVQKPVVVDPEMDAINGTLDKILAIQRPHSAVPSTAHSHEEALVVNAGGDIDSTYFGKRKAKEQHGFLNDGITSTFNLSTIQATVQNEQTVYDGSIVKLSLSVGISIGTVQVPAGTNITGIASLESERLHIHIYSIRYMSHLLPVSLSVYDLDGLEGIYVPGSIGRDVAKASVDNAIQSTGIPGFDMSLKTQAAAAGIGAAKNLLSKKVKQVRVSLTAGYQVLLRDKN